MSLKNEYIIFDTEYTTWVGCNENGWNEPYQEQEIFQIGAIKIKNDEIVDTFSCLIKPTINPVLSDYAVNLTKITNSIIQENGLSLKKAYNNFVDFIDGLDVFSYGFSENVEITSPSDGRVLNNDLKMKKIKIMDDINYFNSAYLIKKYAKKNKIDISHCSSGELAKYLGIEEEIFKYVKNIDTHNALYDSVSQFVAYKYLRDI